jgi:hypothetical protein
MSQRADADADVRLISFGPIQKATVHSGGLAMSLDQLREIAAKVAGPRRCPVRRPSIEYGKTRATLRR